VWLFKREQQPTRDGLLALAGWRYLSAGWWHGLDGLPERTVPLVAHVAVPAAAVRVKSDLSRAYPGSQNQETGSAKSLTQRAKPSGSLPETKRHWLTWEVERGREADPNNLPPSPHRLVRRACDCALDDDRPQCADLRPSQIPPRVPQNPSEPRVGLAQDRHRTDCVCCSSRRMHPGGRRLPVGRRSARSPPLTARPPNAAVHILGVQGDPSPSCRRLLEWVSEGQDV